MPTPISGGCFCGAVRYTVTGEPSLAAHCHCRDCQKAHGGGHASGFLAPKESVNVTGEVKFFDSKGVAATQSAADFARRAARPL